MNYHKPLPKEQYERISAEMSQSKMAHGGDIKGMIDYEIQMRGICKNHNCTIDQYRASEKIYKEGGNIAEENRQMVANNNKQIAHHTKELADTLKKADEVPAWVVAKVNRSASDLSDVTHYLDGEIEYAKGGRMPSVSEANIKDLEGEYVEFYAMGVEETKTYRIANARISPKIFTKRDVTLIFEEGADAIMPLEKLDDYLKGKTISLTDYKGEKYAIKRVGKMAKGGKTGLLRNGKYTYEKGDEGMYEGNEVRVVKYEIGSEMYVFDILNEDGKVIDHNVAKKDKFEKQFAYFPKKAKGGGVQELTQVEGYFSNNDVNSPYTFSSNGKGLDRLTNHKNIEVLSVGYGKKDFFYGWDDSKNDGTLYFGKWNEGNFGYKFYGKINYAKGGVTELHISDQANLNDVLADARKLSISQKTPMYIFQRPSGEYVIADDEDSKMYELDKMNSRFVTFYANGKKYEDGGMMAKGGIVRLLQGTDAERTSAPPNNIEKDLLDKVGYDDLRPYWVGNFGWRVESDKKSRTGDGYLFMLDDYDKSLVKNIKLKPEEYIFRYFTRTSAVGGMTPLIKINIDKGLLYFSIPNENDELIFESKGVKAMWVNLNQSKLRDPKFYAKGGQTQKEYIAEKVGKVMHEFKQGDLRSSSGQKVTNPKQAIAIGLSEGRAGWKHKRKK